MRATAFIQLLTFRRRVPHANIFETRSRRSSTSTETLQSSLLKKLTSRSPNIIFDYLSPTSSHLLNITLADFLPESCYPSGFSTQHLELPLSHNQSCNITLPQGHHTVYFSPQVPSSRLLPDGTDPLQSPGEPFVRRMWAGGSLEFDTSSFNRLTMQNEAACCTESISDVSVKGLDGDEKVYVTIKREIGTIWNSIGSSPTDTESGKRTFISQAAIEEKRNLVFMRQKSPAAARSDAARPGKILKPPHEPDFSVMLTPTQSLLFRFSALTFNAHYIHLDPQYSREVEGHRNLLVHGPLSLVLMLSVLRSQLKEGTIVQSFHYKNLAPLYANEQMKICVRKDRGKGSHYDVWILGREGGYAVKGTAVVASYSE